MSNRLLATTVAAIAFFLEAAVAVPVARACQAVSLEGDVLEIDTPHRSLLAQVRVRTRDARARTMFAEIRVVDSTVVTEDGVLVGFDDIQIGDRIQAVGIACRCDDDCVFAVPFVVTADLINIDNSLVLLDRTESDGRSEPQGIRQPGLLAAAEGFAVRNPTVLPRIDEGRGARPRGSENPLDRLRSRLA